MFCKQCGNEIAEGVKFCTNCGAPVQQYEQQADVNYGYNGFNQNYNQHMQPIYQPDAQVDKLQGEILKMGILGLAFACSFALSFLGIIFSAIAKKKANEYINLRGQLDGRARVGFNLAKPGLIVGIVLTVFWAIYIVAAIAISISAGMNGMY